MIPDSEFPTVATVAFASHAAATLVYLGLIVLLVARWRVRGIGLAFLGCLGLTAAWAALAAAAALQTDGLGDPADLLDALRLGGWLGFLALLLAPSLPRPLRLAVAGALGALVAINLAGPLARLAADLGWFDDQAVTGFVDSSVGLVTRLALPVAGLILIENLVRNGSRNGLWAGKFLFVALGTIWAYDLFVDAHALLFRRIDPDLLAARGAIQVLVAPLLAVAAARNPSWSLDIGISRRAVFHTAALSGSGLFLLLMAGAGFYLRQFGGSWGPLLQVSFLAGAGILLAITVASGRARGQLRVFISKHFFSYKYDYRVEWRRFIDTLTGAGGNAPLGERVIEAVADLMDSPGGALWLRPVGGSEFVPGGVWNFAVEAATEPADGAFARSLEADERIVRLPAGPDDGTTLPPWLATLNDAWLVVPLKHTDRMLGFLVLRQSRAPRSLNWEDWDLLRLVGRQAASYLAEQIAIQAVADARQLEAFNRRFAFVVHDLKNLVSPLALLLSNATRHGDNPAFQQDLIATVGDSVARMTRLLGALGSGPTARPTLTPVPVAALLERIERARACPALRVEAPDGRLDVTADPDLLATAIGHLVQNAIEAVQGIGSVVLRAVDDGDQVVIEVVDDGPGMSAAFVRDELFRPLGTTKPSGYGIGAFQARELVRDMGGQLDVHSAPGRGTTMRVGLPRHVSAPNPPAAPARLDTVEAVQS